ncbi:tetratricopeptide repeat protein [Deltaproteobacteria bacterium IMCC39524]|nr:tetratricopeptide repeat protein [Deltaproteobacteria bacterium IMCC39524]
MANKDKLLANAQKFISKGQLPKAIGEYRKLVDTFPKDVRNRQKLAELLSRDNKSEDALAEYEVVAKHYTETGFYLKAIALFKQMQKIDASRVDIYLRLAELNENQGLIGNALTEYRNLISFYEKNQMYRESIEVLEKMLELDPENLNFAAKIAECYKASGQHDEALKRFLSIIEPISEKGEHLKVVKLYERFLDICPEDGSSRIPLALAFINTGSADKAIQILKGLLKKSPEDTIVNRYLAEAYVANRDHSNARLTLKHLLKLIGEDLDLRESYVRLCIDAGEPESARDRLEEWKDSFFQAERVFVLQGFYEELKALMGGDTVVTDTLAVIYEAVGETSKLDDLETSSKTSKASEEIADSALTDEAIDDVEALDMVGEDVPDDVEVPDLVADESDEDQPAEKVAAKNVELDLDLDLDLDGPELELEGATTEDADVSLPDVGEDDELEVEVEIDLDDMGDLDLDFDEELSFGEEVAEEEVAKEEEELSLDVDPEFDGVESDAPLEPFDSTFDAAPVGSLDDTDELEILEDLDELKEIETAAELEEVEDLEELEELDEIEELEVLEEVEELEVLEDVEELDVLEDVEPLEEVEPLAAASPAERVAFVSGINTVSELEEAEFYLQQGLYDDAERVLQPLMEHLPELPELQSKIDAINQSRLATEAEPEAIDFVDIMSDLQDDDFLAATDFLDSISGNAAADDELLQKTVSEIDSSDTESHFNLGIAYKEMGLYDDAIAEFEKAASSSSRALDCITLTGQCHMEAGETAAAMDAFKAGLAHEGLSEEGRMSLHFELGMLLQMNGQLLEALEFFQLVAEKDSFFRDVADLVKNLRRELGLDEKDIDDGPQGNRDRVSYV